MEIWRGTEKLETAKERDMETEVDKYRVKERVRPWERWGEKGRDED